MVRNRDLILAVLITFCLAAMLFSVKPIKSQTEPVYNPMYDLNDDGVINMRDIALLARAFGSSGTPVNKTELLAEQDEIDSLNSSRSQCQSSIDSLNATLTSEINNLQSELSSLNTTILTKLGWPDYDSGYVQINQSQSIILTHNLGTTDVLVYMVGDYPSGVPYIHQHDYGGEANGLNTYGAYWSELTTTTIKITRNAQDANWPYVRVMIWKVYNNQYTGP
jgi:hypothetical protein